MLEVNRRSGFTLLELLVTIAVVAIVASLAVPSFQNMIATQRVRSAANDLVASFNFARSEAVKRNTTVTVTPGATWAAGWAITYVDGANTITIRNHEAFDGLTMTGDASISYRGDGRRSGNNDDVSIVPPASSGASSMCIRISATGKPSSDSGACL